MRILVCMSIRISWGVRASARSDSCSFLLLRSRVAGLLGELDGLRLAFPALTEVACSPGEAAQRACVVRLPGWLACMAPGWMMFRG